MVFLGMRVRLDLKVTIVVYFDIFFFCFLHYLSELYDFPSFAQKESAKCRNIDAAFSRNVPMTQQE